MYRDPLSVFQKLDEGIERSDKDMCFIRGNTDTISCKDISDRQVAVLPSRIKLLNGSAFGSTCLNVISQNTTVNVNTLLSTDVQFMSPQIENTRLTEHLSISKSSGIELGSLVSGLDSESGKPFPGRKTCLTSNEHSSMLSKYMENPMCSLMDLGNEDQSKACLSTTNSESLDSNVSLPPSYRTLIELILNDSPPSYEAVTGIQTHYDEVNIFCFQTFSEFHFS